MAKSIQTVQGMRDILPMQTPLWQFLESTVHTILKQYGYAEIRMPIVESTPLFKRAIGEVTDIVEKEMFVLGKENSLALRPEGTAGCVRAGLEHGLLYNQVQRFWYQGAMFRHERPQKGRYRQFQQIGVETFGMKGADIDLELIVMTAKMWQQLGIQDLELQLNSLGTSAERSTYRTELVAYFQRHKAQLDEDSLRRLETNPLRILDSKNPALNEILNQAPALMDYLGEDSKQHFQFICDGLDQLNITYHINPRLVRGLDYYSLTVFEWVTTQLGAQGTVCAGGRYDGLVAQLGGKATPAVGFAMGVDRLIDLLELDPAAAKQQALDAYFIPLGDEASQQAIFIAEHLRKVIPEIKMQVHCGGGKIKAKMKKADASGAEYAFIMGEEELAQQQITVKSLRTQAPQQTLGYNELASLIKLSK